MYKVKLYNNIARKGLDEFTDQYQVGENIENEDAIVVRSAKLHNLNYPVSLKAIARAGAGVNNIDLDACTERGIVVFNTPGANANAVKELVIAGLLLGSRDIYHGIEWTKTQTENENLAKDVETQKKKYAGHEVAAKTLGVVGLGAIGNKVANIALRLDMKVLGYDPYMSVDAAWALSRWVQHKRDLKSLYAESDFITLHLPELDTTRGMINKEAIASMKDGVKIINYARGGLVNEDDMLEALDSGKVALYITDFPTPKLAAHPHVIATPHLGASTEESEENCAVKAAQEVMAYLEEGNIINSVNMPNLAMEMMFPYRVGVIHTNTPKMLSKIADALGKDNANIENMLNKSKKDIAYTLIDLGEKPSDEAIDFIRNMPGVSRVSVYSKEL
ncbi:MAG: 3-phosphoglycerate dehydrogenase [Erysipelotrichaceae bacterium]|nr:3-phosphoglycerate dehydrogenase [Erysipelotrichaceae bacterium]